MKTFNYFFAESEDKAPLNLNEAVDLFDFFYEELSEVERFLVVESLDEEDLYNILWLEEYLEEDLQSGLQRQRKKQKSLSNKMQGRNLDASGKPKRIQPYQRTYHGTSETGSQGISKKGWKDDVNVTRQMRGKGVYTTPDKDVASKYAADRSKKFDPTPGEGKVRTFRVPKSQLPSERMTYQGVGDPKNKGYKTYLLTTQQADKFDVTNDPKEFARNMGKKLLKKPPVQPSSSSGTTTPPGTTKPPVTSSGFTGPNTTIPGQPNAPTGIKQSLKNFGSTVKNVAGKVVDAPAAAGTAVGNVANKQLQRVPGVRNVQAANLKMNRKIGSQASKLKGAIKAGATKVPGGTKALGVLKGVGSFASKAAVPVDVGLRTWNRKSQGQSWKRSIAGGATETAGGLAAGAAGAALGTAILPGVGTVIGGIGGYMAGSGAAGKAFDTVAGKTPQELKAAQVKNRQRQAGGALTGIGGKTTFSKAKDGTGFMSTGVGKQRKTVQLAKTSVVKDPTTGKSEVGHLAFKGGKAVYKRSDAPGTGTTNPFERIGRTFNPGAYKANDAKLAAAKLKTAAASDIKRQQALGVKGSQNLVGPKIVGPKIVGPKPAGGGMGGRRGGGSSPGSIKK